MSWFSKLKQGLAKTAALFSFLRVDEEGLNALEEALLRADVGYETTEEIIAEIRRRRPLGSEDMYEILKEILIEKTEPVAKPLVVDKHKKPFVILMIGVNGAGKTTTIGKMGQAYRDKGLQVAFVAGDTFRAGAVEQLCQWGKRSGCTVYTAPAGADAAGLVYDALKKSQAAGDDVLFIDTAGRLQNRKDLMDELEKIVRVIRKIVPEAPHASLLVLEATVGQNAITQATTFKEVVGVTGLVMTKLDGTAKGGILVALADHFGLPVHAVGVGEQADDLNPFKAEEYVVSLIGEGK